MINHTTLLATDGLALIMEQQKQKSISYEIDSIEPKRQELEVMKKKLIEQIDEKRHNLKLLKLYIDKLGSVRKIIFLWLILYNIYFRLMIGVYVGRIC
jgi:hypothetical protein